MLARATLGARLVNVPWAGAATLIVLVIVRILGGWGNRSVTPWAAPSGRGVQLRIAGLARKRKVVVGRIGRRGDATDPQRP